MSGCCASCFRTLHVTCYPPQQMASKMPGGAFPEGGFKLDKSKIDEEKLKKYMAGKAEKNVS